jgi:hypothetical protein
MASEGRGILSPVRLPVPPLQQMFGSFEFTLPSRLSQRLLLTGRGLFAAEFFSLRGHMQSLV